MNARPERLDDGPAERYVFPASFAQQRLWFLEQLEGSGPAWNVRLPVRLGGPLDLPVLEQAVAAVVARHESLRTTFGLRGGEIVQVVASTLRVPVERQSLPGAPEEAVRRRLGELAGHTFDLEAGPLLRVFLLELAADDHVLLLLSHHIVSDAWSSGVLFRDLAASYAARLGGRQPRWPELPVQYADFAVWQRDWLAGPDLARQSAFWREHLAGAPALLDLPLDHPRPRLQSYRGNRLGQGLPAELTARLKALALAEGVTLFMLLFAAFNVLLARWSGQRDLVVGTPIAGRRRTELEGLVGFFANTLALRTRVDVALDFRHLLRAVRRTALDAFTHQDLPFEKLVEMLKPTRSLAHSPVFQVLFALQNAPWEAESFGDLRVAPAEIAPGDTARFDLSVSATEFEGRLWLGLEYSTDLFEDGTIARLATGFETLLAAIAGNMDSPVATLPVEAPADRERQLRTWQPGPVELPVPASIYALFATQARRTPNAIAVECAGVRLTYAELDARAGAISARLQDAGMTGDGPVAICLGRSPDMLAAVLGVLRAGGHYLPLDPAHPPARLSSVLRDSGARLLFAPAALADQLDYIQGVTIDISTVGAPVGAASAATISTGAAVAAVAAPTGAAAVRADAPAYLIYTSGSTGQPKGVIVPQRAVVNFLASMATTPGLRAGDRLLAVTTLAFDIAVLELLLPLSVGATTVIASDEEVRDPQQLMRILDGGGITVMQATPSLWRNLLTAGWGGKQGLRLLCGGEALDRELATRLLGSGAELWNLYGPTETTVWSCVERVTDEPGPVSIGRPIANTRCYVLDEQLEPVPIGARGELWIGGAGVALGYHARPELTGERFRPDPFHPAYRSRVGNHICRTGDRARWRADGRLEVLGRTDFQLKLRGFRIEPGEIEVALLAQPGVSAAVLVLREVAGDPRLVAYLVARAEPLADDALLAALRSLLPAYMLPANFFWLSALPLTPNGKVDRAALALLPLVGAPSGATVAAEAAPTSAAEMALCAMFRDLLGVPVARDDDFFARGGHSLLATRLVARIRVELHAMLPLRAVFETPTVRGLAALLPEHFPVGAGSAATGATAPIPREEGSRLKALLPGATAPLSLVQQRLWFLERLQPGNAAYHLAWAFELGGLLDRPALQLALDGLLARHGSLRTHFRERDGEPEQVLGEATGLALQVVAAGVAAVAAEAAPTAASAAAAEFAARPFRLATGPLVRALLIEGAPHTHTLVLVVHHIVADGWSFGVLSRELSLRYAAARRCEPVALPPLVRDYADYAREQRRALAGGELARQLAYWQAQLRDAPAFLELPTDRPRPAFPSGRGARLARMLPPGLPSALRELARGEGCTLFMVLLAAFDLLLARYAGTEDVLVGTPIAGRPHRDLEELIGFFVNTLVLRTDLRGNPTVRELLARVRSMTLAAYEHAEVPFELLVEALQPPRSTSRSPLFQVLFNLHSEPVVPLELEGLDVKPVAIPRHTAKFDLSVSLAETPAGLAVSIEYNTDVFLEASIERFVTDYSALLAAFAAAPDARLTAVPFSPPAISDFPHLALSPASPTLAAAFAAQLARNPEARAVSAPATGSCAAVDLSYGELARESAAVAAALALEGLRPGERVGLYFGHGAGQVAGILGILLSGGAYVPLDPAAPPARLERIIRDAGLSVLLTDGSAPEQSFPGLRVVRLEELPPAAGPAPSVLPVDPDALAYVLYTSGSTGAPKGVPQTHRNVLHFVGAWAGNLGLTGSDRLSLLSTCGYDASVQDIFGALLTGASVCPLDVRRMDRETLLERIADRGLSVLHGTPTVYRYLFGGHIACRQDLSRVRLVVVGGEVARRADLELFRARFRKGARFVNGYGLTEATAVTQWFAGHETHPWGHQLPIGRAIGGLTARLVDASGAPAPIIGELVLESIHVAPGYWPLPIGAPVGAASAATPAGKQGVAAVAAPTGAPRVSRRLRTGDIARYLPDGNLSFVGRRDGRMKIGGIRMEPGDIESALREHPGIGEALVLAPEQPAGVPVLSACYTGRNGEAPPAPADLRAHLRARLPAALIPARFHPCADLPLLPNGKVDRQALARVTAVAGAPVGAPLGATSSLVAPKGAPTGTEAALDPVQATLRDIWQGLLQRTQVGLDEDFFLLGGHSLLATRLVARVRDRLGVELPLIRVFEAPTIRGLARFLGPDGIRTARPDDRTPGEQADDNSPRS